MQWNYVLASHLCGALSIYPYLKAGVENRGMISSLILNQKVRTRLGMMDGLCPKLEMEHLLPPIH